MSKPERLVILDGNAILYRAFFALPPLTTRRTGESTQAVYGFANMLFKAIKELKPDYVAVAFDAGVPTFRHTQFEAYKAQRPQTPEDLARQMARVRQLVEAFGIPIYEVPGYEADDLIGALCRQAVERGVECVIVTADLDALQLVGPGVKVLAPRRGLTDTALYDEEAVRRRFGLEPWQLVDFKALRGDPSDNIPNVPGVGEKTAMDLIKKFGSIDELYARLDEVRPPELAARLKQAEELVRRNRELVKIKTDAPVTLNLERCRVGRADRSRVLALLRELEFHSLVERLDEILPPEAPAPAAAAAGPEGAEVGLGRFLELARPAPAFGALAVGTSPRPMWSELHSLTLAVDGAYCFIPVHPQPEFFGHAHPNAPERLQPLAPLFADPEKQVIGHDLKQLILLLRQEKIEVKNRLYDTMIAAYLLGEKAIELNELVFSYLGEEVPYPGKKSAHLGSLPLDVVKNYQVRLARRLRELVAQLDTRLVEQNQTKLFHEVEMPLVPVLADMEWVGVAIDVERLGALGRELNRQLRELELKIYNLVGHQFNLNSPRQLGVVLFEELGLPRGRKTKTGYSTAAQVLEELRGTHPVIDLLLEYRQLSKLKSTYVDALPAMINPRTGRVHTSFNQAVVATGRISSSDPNLQNIPARSEVGRQIRRAFIAAPLPDGTPTRLISADYSQIELRILAHITEDPNLIEAFRAGQDIHTATAAKVFGVRPEEVTPVQRRVAKMMNFAVVYGVTEYGLAIRTELSREEAAEFIRNYFAIYPKVKEYTQEIVRLARRQGYVETLLGRRRYLPEINSANATVRMAAERMAINMPIQGTAADIMKIAMVKLHRRLKEGGYRANMILQVHDELVLEAAVDQLLEVGRLVREVMTTAFPLKVPLEVEVNQGPNWDELEPLEPTVPKVPRPTEDIEFEKFAVE